MNFANWELPDLGFGKVKLDVERIDSREFKIEEGISNVLRIQYTNVAKVKVRFKTSPPMKDIPELSYFSIHLVHVVSTNEFDEPIVLRKVKSNITSKNYKDITLELDGSKLEEGTYFLRVFAENENGIILNDDDDFKSEDHRLLWENEKKNNSQAEKRDYSYKKTNESVDFFVVIDDVEIEEGESLQRKDKVSNVLQAYFKYRSSQLKKREELNIPIPSQGSNCWLDDKNKILSKYYIHYNNQHNYQILIPTKLRRIQEEFLNYAYEFGTVEVELPTNEISLDITVNFCKNVLNDSIPEEIHQLRAILFSKIKNSTPTSNGIFESADIFNYIDDIRAYLSALNDWISSIHQLIEQKKQIYEEGFQLKDLVEALQSLDIVQAQAILPNNEPCEAIILSPIHPLRLIWIVQLYDLFKEWEKKTVEDESHTKEWFRNLDNLFDGDLTPENNPLFLINQGESYQYAGELSFGYGIYLPLKQKENDENATSNIRELKYFFSKLLNIDKNAQIENEVSQKLVVRHLRNYLYQHPYTEKLVINLFNAGDAGIFANAFIELEKDSSFKSISYEVRIFRGGDLIIEQGEGLRNLLNPEYNTSEEAEAFSQSSRNRLFPKLRFSINEISDYLKTPNLYSAHISFLISPFPLEVGLIKSANTEGSFALNGLLTNPMKFLNSGKEYMWQTYIKPNELVINNFGSGRLGIKLFSNWQSFVANALAVDFTYSYPSKILRLTEKDKVLISHLHDFSDWVITFDKNLGPEIFDQPTREDEVPFLLDYIPGEETSGIASYLTTRPTSEIVGLLSPHFSEFGVPYDDDVKIKILLEDLRAVSSSLILQLNSSKNKAFEVIGSAFTKRVLEKKGFLKNAFLIPIDLHQSFFEGDINESKSRADNLLVSINPDTFEININVLEIKCRNSLGIQERNDLKLKMLSQIDNTIEALKKNFDFTHHISSDRLDRELKNLEFKSFLQFYLERAYRFNFLSEIAYQSYQEFLQNISVGFTLNFKKIGFIFDINNPIKHNKELDYNNDFIIFTFGGKLIEDILDENSDLNTYRLENSELNNELNVTFNIPDIKKTLFKTPTQIEEPPKKTYKPEESPIIVFTSKDTIHDNEKEVKENNNGEKLLPTYDILVGKDNPSPQYGILGKTALGKTIAVDLNDTNTISLFGAQGGGKSYTIGVISEMVIKEFSNINVLPSPLAGVIFHYNESADYAPEFTSMKYPNNKATELKRLKEIYGAEPENIDNIILLTPQDKVEERRKEYPSIEIRPISFNSKELNVQDWLFLLGAIGNDSTYIKQLKAIMKENRRHLSISNINSSIENSQLLSNNQKALARQRINFASDYIDDEFYLKEILKPERLVIVDLRDEFITKDEALGLFVIILNIFSGVKEFEGQHFNKFIVFDEAHKYMNNKDLTSTIVTAIREMRHKGVSIMIASQDPPSLPNEIIELSSIVLLHKFNSPQWLKHIQKSITQLKELEPHHMSSLNAGEGFLWASKATDKIITNKPLKIQTRPRVTLHGGATIQAIGNK